MDLPPSKKRRLNRKLHEFTEASSWFDLQEILRSRWEATNTYSIIMDQSSIILNANIGQTIADFLHPHLEIRPYFKPNEVRSTDVSGQEISYPQTSIYGGITKPFCPKSAGHPSCETCEHRMLLFIQLDCDSLPDGFYDAIPSQQISREKWKNKLFQFFFCESCLLFYPDDWGDQFHPFSKIYCCRFVLKTEELMEEDKTVQTKPNRKMFGERRTRRPIPPNIINGWDNRFGAYSGPRLYELQYTHEEYFELDESFLDEGEDEDTHAKRENLAGNESCEFTQAINRLSHDQETGWNGFHVGGYGFQNCPPWKCTCGGLIEYPIVSFDVNDGQHGGEWYCPGVVSICGKCGEKMLLYWVQKSSDGACGRTMYATYNFPEYVDETGKFTLKDLQHDCKKRYRRLMEGKLW